MYAMVGGSVVPDEKERLLVSFKRGRGAFVPPWIWLAPLENSVLHVKSFSDTKMVNYVCVKTFPEFTKFHLIKRSKIEISLRSMPSDPTCFAHRYIFDPPPDNPYNLILPPPWPKS